MSKAFDKAEQARREGLENGGPIHPADVAEGRGSVINTLNADNTKFRNLDRGEA